MENKGKQPEIHKTHVKTPDFYNFYADKHFRSYKEGRTNGIIDKSTPYYVDYSTYCKVLNDFNLALRDLIIYKNLEFQMPSRMGTLSIKKKKLTPWFDENGKLVNCLPVNWKKTKELWEIDPKAKEEKKLVRHYNQHTKGFVMKWYLSKRTANFKWKSAYFFIPCRTAKSKLGQVLRENHKDVDFYLA